jgi:FkbM family methyltransferase
MLSTLKSYLKLILGRGTFCSYAQNGEDAVLHSLLRNVPAGTYLDVGAYHPTLYSNTYALYRRGWKGIVIDANADMAPLYKAIRPRDTFVNAGVGRNIGEQTYYVFKDGAYNTFDAKEADEHKQKNYPIFREERKVVMRPLSAIMAEHAITEVGFLNIDIEGLDIEALESYNWALPPKVIAIESQHFNPDKPQDDPVYRYLQVMGYELKGMTDYTLLFVQMGRGSGAVV